MALETHAWMRALLLNFVLLGTCALIGDGILTPAISGAPHSARQTVLCRLFLRF
jgi:K+ transporter